MWKDRRVLASIVLAFLAGGLVGMLFEWRTPVSIAALPALREPGAHGYTYISPLLLCQTNDASQYEEFLPLKGILEQRIEKAHTSGTLSAASIYIRDLERARWVGVNENETYSPASLLKVPVMIAYFKQAERKPELLSRTFFYQRSPANENPLVSSPLLENGGTYSASELIRGMIVDSDNDAKDLLVGALDDRILDETYTDLGIASPYGEAHPSESAYRISTKTYALFFRVLYNATLLSRAESERALALLSESRFPKGLRAGIPEDVSLAHKYGIRVASRNPLTIELSDCGIVYSDKPYILCVMTRGSDPEKLAEFITGVGKEVHGSMAGGS